ncbi:MAG: hypothetical protein AB1791_05965 [Chloroflexota bacterium]
MDSYRQLPITNYRLLWQLGLTTVLMAYFLPWLPHPAAGLSFIGLEMGEWVKFLPQVQAGEIAPGRHLFYLPPITLGLILALLTATWPNGRWPTWAMRGLAVAVSWLAFPAVEELALERIRLLGIGLVILVTILSSFAAQWPGRWLSLLLRLLVVIAALAGAVLPTWAYLAVRPAVSQVLAEGVGIGPGVWLNLAGHLMVVIAGIKPDRISETYQV